MLDTRIPEAELQDAPPTERSSGSGEAEPDRTSVEVEPASATWTATSPATDGAVTASRGNRRRWLLGGSVAAAAIGFAIWAIVALSARPLPEAFRFLPGDSVIVLELRPDLPGDQRAHLGNLLAHFPGFADQSNLSVKLDEVLARLVSAASKGSVDYLTRVKPVLAGPMVMAIGRADLVAGAGTHPATGAILVMTTDGTVDCDAIFGFSSALETYRDVDLRTVVGDGVCAMDGKYLLVGGAAGVHAGIDARFAGTGMDTSSRYRAGRAALEGDQVATLFVDGSQAADLLTSAMATAGTNLELPRAPEWAVVGVRILDDAVTLDLRTAALPSTATTGDLPTVAPAAESRLAPVLPADTLGFLEVHGVGAAVQRGVAALRDNPGTSAAVGQIEQQLSVVGGLANLVGWIEEFGIAVFPMDTGTEGVGGAVLLRGNADKVTAQLVQIQNLLVLAATGTDITTHEREYAGATITTVDLGDVGALADALGVPGVELNLKVKFSLAARDGVLMLTIGDGVAEKLLDVPAGAALDSSSSYKEALRLAGTPNNAQVYVALDGLLTWAEAHLPADLVAGRLESLRPYLDHLAALAASHSSTSAGERARLVLTVK